MTSINHEHDCLTESVGKATRLIRPESDSFSYSNENVLCWRRSGRVSYAKALIMTRLLIDDKDMIYIRMSGTNVSFECDLNYLSVAVSLTCRCCLSRIHMFLLYLLLLLSDFNIYSLVKWCSDLVAFHATVVLPLYLFISHMHHPTVFMSTAWVRVNSVVSKSCSTCYI